MQSLRLLWKQQSGILLPLIPLSNRNSSHSESPSQLSASYIITILLQGDLHLTKRNCESLRDRLVFYNFLS